MNRRSLFLWAASLFFMLTSTLSSAAIAGDDTSPWEMKLPFKSAIIEYKISGMEKGSQTTYIKDYGKYRATYRNTSMKIMGITNTTKNIEITTPEWIYSIDLSSGTGTKGVNPVKYMKEEYEKLSPQDRKKVVKNAEKMGTNMMNGMEGEVRKNSAEFLGRKCDVITMAGMKMYILAGTDITLKTETSMMGMNSVTEAVKFKETSVPDDKFQPPAGINIEYDKESDEIARQMARNVIRSLVEGKPMDIKGVVISPQGRQAGGAPVPAATQSNAPAGPDQGGMPDMNELMKQLKGLTGQK